MKMQIKRAYEQASSDDGCRVLVDRLWPRGISKEDAHLDFWFKELAPSTELRQWFGHDPAKWREFQERYIQELDANANVLKYFFAKTENAKTITLVYSAKDEQHNDAVVLLEYLRHHHPHKQET